MATCMQTRVQSVLCWYVHPRCLHTHDATPCSSTRCARESLFGGRGPKADAMMAMARMRDTLSRSQLPRHKHDRPSSTDHGVVRCADNRTSPLSRVSQRRGCACPVRKYSYSYRPGRRRQDERVVRRQQYVYTAFALLLAVYITSR